MAVASSFISASTSATSSGMHNIGLAAQARLPLMVRDAELPRLANQRDIFIGTVGLDLAQQRFESLA